MSKFNRVKKPQQSGQILGVHSLPNKYAPFQRDVVVKVQAPLMSNAPEELWLVYPQDRQQVFETPPTPEMRAMMNGDPKGYFEARISLATPDAKPQVVLFKRVKAQPW